MSCQARKSAGPGTFLAIHRVRGDRLVGVTEKDARKMFRLRFDDLQPGQLHSGERLSEPFGTTTATDYNFINSTGNNIAQYQVTQLTGTNTARTIQLVSRINR